MLHIDKYVTQSLLWCTPGTLQVHVQVCKIITLVVPYKCMYRYTRSVRVHSHVHLHVHVGPYRYAIYNVSLLWCTPVPYKCMHRYSSTQGVCVYIVMYVHVCTYT